MALNDAKVLKPNGLKDVNIDLNWMVIKMKKYLKALLEGFRVAFIGFDMLVLPMFAIYVFVEVVPKLPEWWGVGAAIVACVIFAASIGAIIIRLKERDQ